MDQVEHGREWYRRRAWSAAYQALRAADEATPLGGDDLNLLATAAYLTGRDLEFHRLHERLHRLHADANDRQRAARSASWLALTLLLRGEVVQARAWVARGQRLVDDHDSVERGYLMLTVAELQMRDGQLDLALETSDQLIAIGERFEDADLTAAARHGKGRALVEQGDVVGGLTCLDGTMLAVVADDLSPIMTALMYCSVIDTCRQVYALDRAREWTSAFSRVCEQQPEMLAFTGICLVHRAELMQLQGPGRTR